MSYKHPALAGATATEGRLDAPVAKELLDRPDVIAIEQKVGRKLCRSEWQVACLVIPAFRAAESPGTLSGAVG